jgi:hypothetical protein
VKSGTASIVSKKVNRLCTMTRLYTVTKMDSSNDATSVFWPVVRSIVGLSYSELQQTDEFHTMMSLCSHSPIFLCVAELMDAGQQSPDLYWSRVLHHTDGSSFFQFENVHQLFTAALEVLKRQPTKQAEATLLQHCVDRIQTQLLMQCFDDMSL